MKLRELLTNLPAPMPYTHGDYSEIADSVGISLHFLDDHSKWDAHVAEVWIAPWYCTDTWVGLAVITLDGEPVMFSLQTARKNTTSYDFVSKEAYYKMRDFVLSCMSPEEVDVPLADMDEEMDDGYQVSYASQILSKHVLLDGQKLEVIDRWRGDYSLPSERWGDLTVRMPDGSERKTTVNEVKIPYFPTL